MRRSALRSLAICCGAVVSLACKTDGALPTFSSSPAAAPVSAPLQEFVAAVEVVQHEAAANGEVSFRDALGKLAIAVAELSDEPQLQRRSKRIEFLAQELRSTRGAETKGAVLAALDEAVAVLREIPHAERAVPYERSARQAVAGILAAAPMTALIPTGIRVLADVANGLLVSVGADPVLEPEKPKKTRSSNPVDPRAHGTVLQASAIVATLTDLSGRELRQKSADAIEVLLRAADGLGAAHDEEVRSRIRFEVKRLRSPDDAVFQSASWLRSALVGLIHEIRAPPGGDAWLDRARSSAQAIDPENALVFQRARLQEALRCTTDALLAFSSAASRNDADQRVVTGSRSR